MLLCSPFHVVVTANRWNHIENLDEFFDRVSIKSDIEFYNAFVSIHRSTTTNRIRDS